MSAPQTQKDLEEYYNPAAAIFVDRYGRRHVPDFGKDKVENRSGVFAVIVADHHILLTCPPWAPDCAELPGGGVETGETDMQALKREVFEETGEALPEDTRPGGPVEHTLNFYAENEDVFIRYQQRFYNFRLSGLNKQGKTPYTTKEGHTGFWHPFDSLNDLTLRFRHGDIIENTV